MSQTIVSGPPLKNGSIYKIDRTIEGKKLGCIPWLVGIGTSISNILVIHRSTLIGKSSLQLRCKCKSNEQYSNG
jgi:hypothetical protein